MNQLACAKYRLYTGFHKILCSNTSSYMTLILLFILIWTVKGFFQLFELYSRNLPDLQNSNQMLNYRDIINPSM